DGQAANHASNTATTTIVLDQAPVLDLDGNDSTATGANFATTFTENGAAVAIADTDVSITDADAGATVASATINLTNHQAGDSLPLTGSFPANITASSYNAGTGVLTLTTVGTATAADYQSALQRIEFTNSSDNPSTVDRDITVVVNDGFLDSNLAHATVHVAAVNDAPVVTAGNTLSYTENQAAPAISPAATVTDVDSADFNGGSLTASFGATGHAEDQLTIENQGTGAGQIGVSGNSVTFGGVAIGTFSGGAN